MRLLMITRRVDRDDAQAGFTYAWVGRLARRTETLGVMCLEKGNVDGLPENVEIFSLGKEGGKNRFREFINFQRGALKFIKKVDGVFCHQNPEYAILIGPYVKVFGKKLAVWYSHKAINWRVRIMDFFADRVLTPTSEGFGLNSKKKVVVGHGIDTELFAPGARKTDKDILRIISVGRLSPIKDYETLIDAAEIVSQKNISLRVEIVGGLGLVGQQAYVDKLKRTVAEKELGKIVVFEGLIPNRELPEHYRAADMAINLCPTGSPDKAVLEAMACGIPALACNRTFVPDFGPYADKLIFQEKNPQDLARKIIALRDSGEESKIGLYLREQVVEKHNLDKLIQKILDVFEKIR